MARAWCRVLTVVAVLSSTVVAPPASHAEIIDRILAVVDRELITLSDVLAALRLGLAPQPAAGTDPVRGTLDALIARQLELTEASRYQPPEPAPAQIQAGLDAIAARFRTPEELQQALNQSGLTTDQLRLRVRDDLRIEAYLSQRFGAAVQPSDQEVVEYYRTHAAELSTAAGVPPLEEVRQDIRTRLSAARRMALVADWVEGLRRRTEIADLYVEGR